MPEIFRLTCAIKNAAALPEGCVEFLDNRGRHFVWRERAKTIYPLPSNCFSAPWVGWSLLGRQPEHHAIHTRGQNGSPRVFMLVEHLAELVRLRAEKRPRDEYPLTKREALRRFKIPLRFLRQYAGKRCPLLHGRTLHYEERSFLGPNSKPMKRHVFRADELDQLMRTAVANGNDPDWLVTARIAEVMPHVDRGVLAHWRKLCTQLGRPIESRLRWVSHGKFTLAVCRQFSRRDLTEIIAKRDAAIAGEATEATRGNLPTSAMAKRIGMTEGNLRYHLRRGRLTEVKIPAVRKGVRTIRALRLTGVEALFGDGSTPPGIDHHKTLRAIETAVTRNLPEQIAGVGDHVVQVKDRIEASHPKLDDIHRATVGRRQGSTVEWFTINAMKKITSATPKTITRFARLAGLPRPGRGGKTFRWSHADGIKLVAFIRDTSSTEFLVERCRNYLANGN
jgi:hypothetical protein